LYKTQSNQIRQLSKDQYNLLRKMCWHSARLYNFGLYSIRRTSGGNWSGVISSHILYPKISNDYITGSLAVTIYVYSEPNFQGNAKSISYLTPLGIRCDSWSEIPIGFLGIGGNWDNKVKSLEIILNGVKIDEDCLIFDN